MMDVYKIVDQLLKVELAPYKKNNKKPFSLSQNRHTITIQFPILNYPESFYLEWYQIVSKAVNSTFYKKESDYDILPDYYQQRRLFMIYNGQEIELNTNIVVREPLIYVTPPAKKTKKSKLDYIVSEEPIANQYIYVESDNEDF